MLGDGDDEFERQSFSELANAKGRGVLTPGPTGAHASGLPKLSLGKKASARAVANSDPPVAKPVSRDSGWEASFDNAGDGKVAGAGHEADTESQIDAHAQRTAAEDVAGASNEPISGARP